MIRGINRQVTKAVGSKGTVIQSMNYYPFGTQFCDGSASNNNVQSHKYNGNRPENRPLIYKKEVM